MANYGISIAGAEKSEVQSDNYVEQFSNAYSHLKDHLLSNSLSETQQNQLINGLLSDALTHVGQIAYLRRLFGEPIEGRNYANAKTG